MNPTWNTDEVLLAYDLYLHHGRKVLSINHPDVVALSEELRALPWHQADYQDPQFRNPQGLVAKLGQLRAYELGRKPFSISNVVRDLALAYRDRPDEVRRLAKQIRETLAVSRDGDFSLTEPDQREDTETFPEGRVLERAHKVRERNRSVITKKFAEVMRLTGKLACEACGFDYEAAYGELGQGYAECHHNVPLSAMGIRQTRLQDLAVVCSNCHAMIHHRRPWLTVAELKKLVRR